MPVIELQTVSVVLSIILLLFQHVKCAWNFQSAIIIQPTNTLDFYLAKYIWKIICRHICGPSGKIFSFTSKKWPNWKEKGDNWICPFRNVNFYTSRMWRTVQGGTGSTISITVGYWAAFVIAIPYLTADRSQQKSLNRAGTKLTENFGLMLTIYMGRMFH